VPDDVVITGLGVMSPIGCDEPSFWKSLCEGRSGARPVTSFDTSELPRKIACQVQQAVPLDRPMGRAAALAVAAAKQALSSARLDRDRLAAARVSIGMGTTMGETQFIEERLACPPDDWLSPDHAEQMALGVPGSISLQVQRSVGTTGEALDLFGACAAGNLAIEAGRRRLLDGECDLALVGGADGFSQLAFVGFMRARVMAAECCRPFDQARDGLLVGEGAGVLVLERDSHARARNAPVRARVVGAANVCESYHPTRPHPDGDGLSRATVAALEDAGLSPSQIDYVCAHGTGTPHNDAIEVKVLERCFPQGVAFSSIKALTGHPMGAAAALEAICCVLSLERQTLIPTWNLNQFLQPCSLDAVRNAPRSAPLTHVVNNSAGFGGYNSSVVLARA